MPCDTLITYHKKLYFLTNILKMDVSPRYIEIFNTILFKYHNKISFKLFLEEFNMKETIDDEFIYKLSKDFILIDKDMIINFETDNDKNIKSFIKFLKNNEIKYSSFSHNYYVQFAIQYGLPIPIKKTNEDNYFIMKKEDYISALILCKNSKDVEIVKLYYLYNEYLMMKEEI